MTAVCRRQKGMEDILVDKNTMRDLEDRRCHAMINADIDVLTSLFSDRLVWTHSSASKDDKAALLSRIAGGKTKYVTIKRLDEQHIVSDTSFVATGLVEMNVKIDGVDRQMRSR